MVYRKASKLQIVIGEVGQCVINVTEKGWLAVGGRCR